MSHEEEEGLEMLDPVLQDLFEAESRFPAETSLSQEVVWQKVVMASPALKAAMGTTLGASATATTAATTTITLGKTIGVAVMTFILGTGTGAIVYRSTIEPPKPEKIIVEVPVKSKVAEVPVPVVKTKVVTDESVSVEKKERRPALRLEDKDLVKSKLTEERAIIDVIRAAIARNNSQSALKAVARHRKEFPKGILSEEREGLRIIALSKAGQHSLAQALAKGFRKKYPQSLLNSAIDQALIKSQ